ncbi:MAG: amino acid ABC transporter substrate-binding protein, partial [Comamonadaceae bacterium]
MKTMRHSCIAGLLSLSAVSAAAQIVIGQTAGITGPVAASVNETIAGAQLVIDQANAQGGIHGEQIEVLRLDDGFDVKRAGENGRVLIEDKKVLAMFLNRGTPHTQAIIPHLDKNGVALIAPSTGAMVLHKPLQKHVFNVRSSYQREAEKAVQHLHTVGIDRIAIVHASDSFGQDGLEGANNGFTKGKFKPVAIVPADRDKPDYTAIVPALGKANPQAVLWIGSGSAVVEGVKALRAAGSTAQIVTLS